MITLDEYKQHLISIYIYEIDNDEIKRNERRRILSKKYNDKLLEKIIKDTYSFIEDIYKSNTIKDGYCSFEIEEDTTSYISLGITGGGASDILFKDSKERIISKFILKNVFGNFFDIYVKEEEIPFKTGDKYIMSFDYRYYLYMQGFPKNMNNSKTKQLIK